MVLAVNIPAQLPMVGQALRSIERQLLVGQGAGGPGPDGFEHAHDVEGLAARAPARAGCCRRRGRRPAG